MKIGDVVTLTIECLGNSPGTRGVVYGVYQDFDNPDKQGVSIIFENGEYDGFSYVEQQVMLNKESLDTSPFLKEYQFTNVMKLSQDFNKGFWDEIFK